MKRKIDSTFAGYFCVLTILVFLAVGCSGDATPEPTQAPVKNIAGAFSSAPGATAAPALIAAPISITPTRQTAGVVADLNFRPDENGFSFENYANDKKYQNLTLAEMQRMFGDQVCGSKANGKCILAPPVKKLMEQYNRAMGGGHCFGFSVLALRFAQNLAKPADFGAATVANLEIEGNEKLQREIAYSYTFQFFDPVNQSLIAGTPNQVLDKLIENLKASQTSRETYTLGFFNAQGGGGHAVTPYAVEDRGGGKYAVLIYDNNLPKTERSMLFDRTTNSWSYVASENPNLKSAQYYGDATTQSLFLLPTTPGLNQQVCPVCAPPESKSAPPVQTRSAPPAQTRSVVPSATPSATASAAPAPISYNALFLHGDPRNHGHLLVTDELGRRYGYLPDGSFVREIPGATHTIILGQGAGRDLWNDAPEPIYYIPTGQRLVTSINGSSLTSPEETAVVAIGPGYYLGIEGINLDPRQVDTLTIGADGGNLSYRTQADESPAVVVGFEAAGPDYEFSVGDVNIRGGGALNVDRNAATGQLELQLQDSSGSSTFDLVMTRIDETGEYIFTRNDIGINPGDSNYVDYDAWSGKDDTLEIQVDEGGDGTIDLTETLETDDTADEETVTPEADDEETLTPEADDEETLTPDAEGEETPTPEEYLETPTEESYTATPTPEEQVEETPTEESYTATPTPEEQVEETPTEESYTATPTPEEQVEETPTEESYTATPTPEEQVEETPTEESYTATPTPEEQVEETPTEESYTATPTPEEQVEETPTEESYEETPTPEEQVEETPTEESYEETPTPEEQVEETPTEESYTATPTDESY